MRGSKMTIEKVEKAEKVTSLKDQLIKVRELRHRVQIVETLLNIREKIITERLDSYFGIPKDFILEITNVFSKDSINSVIYFGLPAAVLKELTYQSDGRAVHRHIIKKLTEFYNKSNN